MGERSGKGFDLPDRERRLEGLGHFQIKINPDRDVVGRLLPAAHIAIDADIDEPVAGLRRKQQVVNPQAPILLPAAGLIVPEGVLAGRVGNRPNCVGQAKPEQRLKRLASSRTEQRIVDPGRWVVNILGRGDDIEIARQNERLLRLQSFFRIVKKPRHPSEFVWIFDTIRRVAIGQIQASDAQHAAL